jgi:hypothetical protein
MKLTDWLADPVATRRFHGWATVVWFVAALPICILLAHSLAFVVWVSVYAVVVAHWSSWQACRAEVKADSDLPNDA